jgi:hypothetical protein
VKGNWISEKSFIEDSSLKQVSESVKLTFHQLNQINQTHDD